MEEKLIIVKLKSSSSRRCQKIVRSESSVFDLLFDLDATNVVVYFDQFP